MKEMDKIMGWLEDEESKYIYQKKVEYNETGNFAVIREIVDRYLPQFKDIYYYHGIMSELINLLKDKEKIVVFGSGVRSTYLLDLLMENSIEINCLVDNDVDRWGNFVKENEIKNPNEVDYKNVDVVIITPSNKNIVSQIHAQLQDLGLEKETIIIDYMNYFPAYLEEEQYFAPDIIKLHEEEIFVDAGALILDTSKRFINECRKNKISNFKIYAFEPDDISYQKCVNVQKSMGNVDLKLYNAGLWSENTTLYFDNNGNGTSKIVQQETACSIETIALDDCVSDKVTFIKMDIEGAELEALKGCKKTIKKYKPKLAICIYHKKEDLLEIPQYIKELVPEYKLYVRHYSNAETETVLYAV